MASGTGRIHLLLGQVDPVASPASAAGELYVLTESYGAPTGTATGALVESPDLAPLGELGRLRVRLLSCPVEYDAACTLRFTPVADYQEELDTQTVALAAPTARRVQAVQVKLLRAVTALRLRIEVTAAAGLVACFTPTLYYVPLAAQSGVAMGERP